MAETNMNPAEVRAVESVIDEIYSAFLRLPGPVDPGLEQRLDAALRQIREHFGIETVTCAACNAVVPAITACLSGDDWIGEDCCDGSRE